MDFSWMAWTWPTAAFFGAVFAAILAMAIWERFSPGGGPLVGVLRFETTRGDRLFITLLGSAFIHLAWLGLVGTNLPFALGISAVYGVLVFCFV